MLSDAGLLSGCHVLIVDDSLIGQAWARYIANFGGGISEVCSTVQQARRQLGLGDAPAPTRIPDIILIDFQLAGQANGSQLAAELRDHPELSTMIRVTISGYSLAHITAGFAEPQTLYVTHLSKLTLPRDVAPALASILHEYSMTPPAQRS